LHDRLENAALLSGAVILVDLDLLLLEGDLDLVARRQELLDAERGGAQRLLAVQRLHVERVLAQRVRAARRRRAPGRAEARQRDLDLARLAALRVGDRDQ